MSNEFSIFAAAAEAPDQPALLIEGKTLSFRELAARTASVTLWLERQGITRSERANAPHTSLRASEIQPVGVVASNQLPTLLLIYALLELAIPVALIHPRLTATERRELLESARVKHIFTPDLLLTRDLPEASPIASPPPRSDWPLAIVFTSGTSGKSRAAVLSRGAFVHSIRASAHNLGWQRQDRWLLCLPLCHVGGLSIVLRCLAARKAVVLAHAQGEHESLDLPRVIESVSRDDVTLLSLVPSVLQRWLDSSRLELPARVRAILLGGAESSPKLLENAADRAWPVLTTYGLTEACSQVTTQPYGTSNRGELGSGKPVLGTEISISSSGAIEIKSPSLFSGYLDDDELLRPFDDRGWFRTSDLGRLDERGHLHVLGRSSELIVSGGENVYPSEVERALESCPGVAAACVFGVDDPDWGQAVAAVVVGSIELRPLEVYVCERLAPHKRPRLWAQASELPQTRLGKLDRPAAARLYTRELRPLKPGS